jgi:RNA polymerase sigma-70 factor (ECF subfamily)
VELSDEALCQRVGAQGDEDAFERLVERHQSRAYRLAWSILGDADEAKDLSQEAFLRVFERASSFDGRSKFSTWFHRILVNLCLDHRRRRQSWLRRWLGSEAGDSRDDALERQPAPPDDDPPARVARKQLMAKAWQALGRLSPQQRAALVLQVEEDLSAKEIARVLDCSEATVRVHLHRGVSALRQIMKEE